MKKTTKEKITVGIVVGVIVAFASIFLQNVVPELPIIDSIKGSQLKITNFAYYGQPWSGSDFRFSVDVYNEGSKTAENCYVFLSDDREESTESINSQRFSLTPDEKKEKIMISEGKYPESGIINMEIQVACDNAQSDMMIRTAEVESP